MFGVCGISNKRPPNVAQINSSFNSRGVGKKLRFIGVSHTNTTAEPEANTVCMPILLQNSIVVALFLVLSCLPRKEMFLLRWPLRCQGENLTGTSFYIGIANLTLFDLHNITPLLQALLLLQACLEQQGLCSISVPSLHLPHHPNWCMSPFMILFI